MSPIRRRREALGLTQQALAARLGMSRQALSAIEAGRSVPAVDVALRLAAALDRRVEDLFGGADTEGDTAVAGVDVAAGQRLIVARVGDVVVALPVPATDPSRPADAFARHAAAAGTPVALEPAGELGATLAERIIVAGCALAIDVVARRLGEAGGAGRFTWWPTSNRGARRLLDAGQAHVVAVHNDDTTGHDGATIDVTLARWQLGVVVRADDHRVRSLADVTAPGLRPVHREAGAGAGDVLRALIGDRPGPTVSSHLDVARAVACGGGDLGVCSGDAAVGLPLRFLPLREERVALLAPHVILGDLRAQRFFDVLTEASTRRDLEALGYDTRESGRRAA